MDSFKEQWMESTIRENADRISRIELHIAENINELKALRLSVDKLLTFHEDEQLRLIRISRDVRPIDPYTLFIGFVKDIVLALISVGGGIAIAATTGVLDLFKNV